MTAKLKPAIPAGGILSQNVDRDFADFVNGRTVEQRVCIGVFQPAAASTGNQEKGRVNTTAYEAIHFVEVTDAHEADRLRHLLMQIRADRGLAARQPALIAMSDEEQRESLIDMIRDWASEQDIPMAEVDARFVDYFGGADNTSAETVIACRSVVQLKEFAYHVGVISDQEPASKGDDEDADDDGFGADEPREQDDDDQAPAVAAVPFQAGEQ